MNSSISSFRFLGICLALALLLTMAASALMRAVYDVPNWKTMAVESLDGTHEILFVGSSRFFFGIDPREFGGRAVSLAGDYLDAQTAERLWRKYGGRMQGVRTVVLEGGLSPLYYDTAKLAPNALRDFDLSVYPTWRARFQDPLGAIREAFWPLWRWRLSPFFWERYQRFLSDDAEPKNAFPGFVPSRVELAFPDEMAASKVAEGLEMIGQHEPELLAANKAAMRRLIAELLGRDLQVVYLRMPIHEAARPLFPEEWRAAVHTEIEDLRRQFASLAIMDEWSREGLQASHFRDPDHLNERGAAIFSRDLASLL